MSIKRSKSRRLQVLPGSANARRQSHRAASRISDSSKVRNTTSMKTAAGTSDYECAIERNQNGKYNVRIRAIFGGQAGWSLTLYFLASSFNAAMKKLEESLQLLQKNEDRLRFWSIERSDDPNMAGDLLQESGMWIDRRREFPRKTAELNVARGRVVPASMLAALRRTLADSVADERPVHFHDRAALAGD